MYVDSALKKEKKKYIRTDTSYHGWKVMGKGIRVHTYMHES